MANHKSAEKRARQTETRRLRNKQYVSSVRTAIKRIYTAIEAGEPHESVAKIFQMAQSALSKAATKGLFHPNNASRRIGRLNHTVGNYLKNAGTAPVATDKPVKAQTKAAASKVTPKAAAKSKVKPTTKKVASAKPKAAAVKKKTSTTKQAPAKKVGKKKKK